VVIDTGLLTTVALDCGEVIVTLVYAAGPSDVVAPPGPAAMAVADGDVMRCRERGEGNTRNGRESAPKVCFKTKSDVNDYYAILSLTLTKEQARTAYLKHDTAIDFIQFQSFTCTAETKCPLYIVRHLYRRSTNKRQGMTDEQSTKKKKKPSNRTFRVRQRNVLDCRNHLIESYVSQNTAAQREARTR
jgi:hypothetical protein